LRRGRLSTCGRQILKNPGSRAAVDARGVSTSGDSSSKKLFIIQMVKARLKAV
jgi:hypothetical protein